MMKKRILALTLAALAAFTLMACGNRGDGVNNGSTGSVTEGDQGAVAGNNNGTGGQNNDVIRKEDCSTVYAEVISVNGDNLTVNAGDQVLSLTARSDLLRSWGQGDQVILYYTGSFGETMQVHYIDKWTENSNVQRPDNQGKGANNENSGSVLE